MDPPVDVVIPVKELDRAKSRLAGIPGGGVTRRALALALAADTVAAVVDARVRSVTVVSPDPRVRAMIAARWGGRVRGVDVSVVADDGTGLDAAVGVGARAVHGRGGAAGRVAALQADLPALRPEELDAALAALPALEPRRPAFVADHTGTGTAMLVGPVGALPDPHFGPGSAAAHTASGARALAGDWPGLRTDVDTPADLARAAALGVGPATAAWLADHGGAADGGAADGDVNDRWRSGATCLPALSPPCGRRG